MVDTLAFKPHGLLVQRAPIVVPLLILVVPQEHILRVVFGLLLSSGTFVGSAAFGGGNVIVSGTGASISVTPSVTV